MASSNEPSQASQVENSSYNSPAVQAGDSTVLRNAEASQLPHAAAQSETPSNTSTAVCGGVPSENSYTADREGAVKQVSVMVLKQLQHDLDYWFRERGDIGSWGSARDLRFHLIGWRENKGRLSYDEKDGIGNFYFKVLSNSVCKVTYLDGERKRSITPPWGMLGLSNSLRDFSFNSSNYLSHHALGILAEHVVRKGMLVAANNGGETAGEMEGQTSNTQDPAVDAKSE